MRKNLQDKQERAGNQHAGGQEAGLGACDGVAWAATDQTNAAPAGTHGQAGSREAGCRCAGM